MRFRRASQRYSTTPVPVTPYQKAAQAWDERIGDARVQARNWRLLAFSVLGVTALAVGGLVWQLGRSTVVPYVVARGAVALYAYARERDPFGRVGKATVAVEVASVVRASPTSFQVRWIERTTIEGVSSTTERWTAIVSVVLQPPRDVVRLRKNPLGIYVDGLDWSRELGSAVGDTP